MRVANKAEIAEAYDSSQGSTCSTLTPPAHDYEFGRGPAGGAYRLSSAKAAAAAAAGKAAAALSSAARRGTHHGSRTAAYARMPGRGGPAETVLVAPSEIKTIEDDGSQESHWLDAGDNVLEDVACMSHDDHNEHDDQSTEHDQIDSGADSDKEVGSGWDRDDFGHVGEPLDCLQDPAACEVDWHDKAVEA